MPKQNALRGRRQGAPRPLNPRARALPLDPKWRLSQSERLAHMPLVCRVFSFAHEACCTNVRMVVTSLPEGYQGNRRGFPWSGVRGRRAPP